MPNWMRNRPTLSNCNFTGCRAKRIVKHEPSEADIVSKTDEQPTRQAPRRKPPRRLGLSGKLLLLTIPLVMIAEILIYVPAIANFWVNRLNGRLAAANTAAAGSDAPR